MRVPNLRTAPKRQSLSNVLGQITVLTKILKNVYPPRPYSMLVRGYYK